MMMKREKKPKKILELKGKILYLIWYAEHEEKH